MPTRPPHLLLIPRALTTPIPMALPLTITHDIIRFIITILTETTLLHLLPARALIHYRATVPIITMKGLHPQPRNSNKDLLVLLPEVQVI